MDKNGEGYELISDEEKQPRKKDNADNIGIEYDENTLLLPDIPVICFMGPSRNGK